MGWQHCQHRCPGLKREAGQCLAACLEHAAGIEQLLGPRGAGGRSQETTGALIPLSFLRGSGSIGVSEKPISRAFFCRLFTTRFSDIPARSSAGLSTEPRLGQSAPPQSPDADASCGGCRQTHSALQEIRATLIVPRWRRPNTLWCLCPLSSLVKGNVDDIGEFEAPIEHPA
jgi:hypothetical protein